MVLLIPSEALSNCHIHTNEQELFDYVKNSIDGSHSLDSWSIQVMHHRTNEIVIRVNKVERILVVLPLGLLEKLPSKIRGHSVEDYYLVEVPR